jgi:hypothetical protein
MRMRLALLGAGLVLVVALVAVGERSSSTEQLRADVAAGSVSSVQAYGYSTGADGQGYSTAQVRWRDGLVQKVARVSAADADSITTELRSTAPGLTVAEVPERTVSYGLYGFSVPLWVQLLAVGSWLTAVLALVRGPRPWRATRWGWVWSFLLVPFIGVPLFCLLSGPTPLVPRPRRVRRLGGAVGLLLALVAYVLIPGG